MLDGRWHASHFCWRIGATSFVKVGGVGPAAEITGKRPAKAATTANTPGTAIRHIHVRAFALITPLAEGRRQKAEGRRKKAVKFCPNLFLLTSIFWLLTSGCWLFQQPVSPSSLIPDRKAYQEPRPPFDDSSLPRASRPQSMVWLTSGRD